MENSEQGDNHPPKRVKENTPPPEEGTWSSIVFLPVKLEPFDIPPLQNEVPTQEVPTESYLENVMASEKETRSVSPSTSEQGQEKQNESGQGMTPGLRKRIRLTLQKDRPITMRIKAPNLVVRLMFVLSLLTRPGVVLDILCMPVNLSNDIELDLRRIHGQVIENKRVPEYDYGLYMLYKGFIHLKKHHQSSKNSSRKKIQEPS